MTRLKIVAEGRTERDFIKEVLAPYLRSHDVYARPVVVSASRLRRDQDHLGGGGSFGKALRTVRDTPSNDPSAYCTTLFDYYGLPDDFPGLDSDDGPPSARLYERVNWLEKRLAREIGDTHRFIPYLQVHEFEALLFADVEVIERAPGLQGTDERSLGDLRSITDHFDIQSTLTTGKRRRRRSASRSCFRSTRKWSTAK